MKKQVQIEDALLDVLFAFILFLVGFFFSATVVKNIMSNDFGWAIFGSVCGAICILAGWLILKNVWSASKN